MLHVGSETEWDSLIRSNDRLAGREGCIVVSAEQTSIETSKRLTRQDLSHVHETSLAADVESARGSVAQAASIRQEHCRCRLDRELFAHEPQTLGSIHRLDHILYVSAVMRK
jgi:hypothetical protein